MRVIHDLDSGMNQRVFRYAIIASIAFHLVLLGIVGRTSAAKPIEVDQLKLVKVDLVRTPEDVNIEKDKPDVPKPEPKVDSPKFSPPAPVVPPVQQMVDRSQVKPKSLPRNVPQPRYTPPVVPGAKPRPVRMASAVPPGDPGGELNLGSSSDRGNISVSQGQTGVGYVPSPVPGRGEGSGTGVGKATRQDPVPDASPGPGTVPAPAYIPPPPPPPPRRVDVKVCAESGKRPGLYCEKTTTRDFIEGEAPSELCDRCKAPEVKHESRLAESKPAELIKDVDVRVPGIVKEAGIKASVKVTYTVNADGSVSDIEVTKSSGNPLLDRAVVEAWSKLKYSPAIQDGQPRSVKKRRTFNYNGG